MRRLLTGLLALALVVAGAALAWRAVRTGDTTSAVPLPSRTYAVASPTPDTRRSAEVPANPDDTTAPAPTTPTPTAAPDTPSPASSSSTTTPASAPVAMDPARMAPDRLYIPSLQVYATLTDEGFRGGRLSLPDEAWRVGRDGGSPPFDSASGTTLLAGHVDHEGVPGALHRLGEVQPGALVYVTDARGERSTFVASGLQTYTKTGLPRDLFDVGGQRRLAVVTCGGPIITVDGQRHYRDNVVLTALPA